MGPSSDPDTMTGQIAQTFNLIKIQADEGHQLETSAASMVENERQIRRDSVQAQTQMGMYIYQLQESTSAFQNTS